PVEAEAADHDHQPAPDVVDLLEVGSQQTSEGLLDSVLGLADVAEHPEADVEQVTSMLAPGPPELDVRVVGIRCLRMAVHGTCSSDRESGGPDFSLPERTHTAHEM